MFLYLGSPYSHPDAAVREERYQSVLTAMAHIAQFKIPVYCPISIWHPVAVKHALPGDFSFWRIQDEAFLKSCYMAWFLLIPGLDESHGVQWERDTLRQMKKPFWNVNPQVLDMYCRDMLKRGAFGEP
jgi:hypothetical protein